MWAAEFAWREPCCLPPSSGSPRPSVPWRRRGRRVRCPTSARPSSWQRVWRPCAGVQLPRRLWPGSCAPVV
eukprot:3770114-Lingulodinium_polyedra.AAC.1